MSDGITLEFLARQMERMLNEQQSFREDMRVPTTIVLRHDSTLNGILDQLHAMTVQRNRIDTLLRRLEAKRAPS